MPALEDNLTARGHKTFFRINNTAGYRKAMVGLLDEMKIKSASVIYSTKEATADLAKDVKHELDAKGIAVGMHAFDPAITDFKPIINKVRLQDKPEVILMVGYENDYVGILRAAKVLKPNVKAMIGVWSLATPRCVAPSSNSAMVDASTPIVAALGRGSSRIIRPKFWRNSS